MPSCYDVDFQHRHEVKFQGFVSSTEKQLKGHLSSTASVRLQEFNSWTKLWSYEKSAEYQWKICHSCVCAVSCWISSTTVYIAVVCCPSVPWLRKAPTDNRLLAGWWLRKATRGGVVMATEACQTGCVEIGQVRTHNQYPPPSTPIWHFRHRIFAVKIRSWCTGCCAARSVQHTGPPRHLNTSLPINIRISLSHYNACVPVFRLIIC